MKRTLVVLVAAAVLVVLFPSDSIKADPPERITHFTVWYACVISPPCCAEPVGEWTLNCDGSMTGWGWEPGHGCTTVAAWGAASAGTAASGGGAAGGAGGGGGGAGVLPLQATITSTANRRIPRQR